MKRFFIIILLFICVGRLFAQVDFTASNVCFGQYAGFTATTTIPDSMVVGYYWDMNADSVYNDAYGKVASYLFQQPDTHLVSVRMLTIDSVYHYAPSAKNIVVYPAPEVNFHVDNLCAYQPAVYMDSSRIDYGTITTYEWDFNNDGLVDDDYSGKVAFYTCGPPQIYVTKLRLTSDLGCKSFTTKTTQVFSQPNAQFVADSVCVGTAAYFINTSSVSNDSIELNIWDFGDSSPDLADLNPSHSYDSAGTFEVRLITISDNVCRDTAIGQVFIRSLPLKPVSNDVSVCEGESTQLSAVGNEIVWYSDISLQNSIGNGTTYQTNITTAGATYFYLTQKDTLGNCESTADTVIVNVNPAPYVYFEYVGDTELEVGESVTITILGETNSVLWSNGDTTSSITVNESGMYSAEATNLNGCKRSLSAKVSVALNHIAVSSNILTPNGDGINDFLEILSVESFISCKIVIYNMWGDKIFESTDYHNDWNGNNGSDVDPGTYYYVIEADNIKSTGDINVLK